MFDIHPTKSYGYTNARLFDSAGNTPVVVNSSQNNGIGGRVNLAPTEKANTITFSDTTTAESIFVQDEMFIGYSHVQGLYPYSGEWTKRNLMYFATIFRKNAIQMQFDYANKFNRSKASDMVVLLPVNNLNQIDFDYMESYITELEQERIRELDAYLKAAGLNDYGLTLAEKNCIELMQNGLVKYKDFRIGDLFESFTGDVDLQNRDLTEDGEFFINSGVQNQGIKGRTTRKAKVFNEGTLTIDFFGNCYYRDFRYKLATHNHVFSLSSPILKNQDVSLYAAAVFSYLKSRHSFNNMLTQTILKNNRIILPVDNNDEIDYQFMELFISALKKLCIRSVVEWKDRLIKTAKAAAV